MFITFLISSFLFILLAGLYLNLQQALVGWSASEHQSVPRASLSMLLAAGVLASLVVVISSGLFIFRQVSVHVISGAALFILSLLLLLVFALAFLWLASIIFSKENIATRKLAVKLIDQEKTQAFLTIDTNPTLDYLSNETEEEKDSAELLENALNLFSIEIKECLIPRNEIVGIELTEKMEEIKNIFIESKHSKLIVYENDMDNILGYVHHGDFYDNPTELNELIREIPTVPETMTAIEMLSYFKKKQKSIAWVVDEFGGTAGILTTEDLLEELFGEIEDEHDQSEYIEQQISSDEFILSGRLEVEYINDKFELEIPTESAETLSGYIIEVHNAIPAKDEKIIIGSYEYKILKVSKTRIETIRLKVIEE